MSTTIFASSAQTASAHPLLQNCNYGCGTTFYALVSIQVRLVPILFLTPCAAPHWRGFAAVFDVIGCNYPRAGSRGAARGEGRVASALFNWRVMS